jgi:predicted Fe-Mo cluster-binding NifX family protein
MKVAISATNNDWKAPVDPRFGRAAGFFIVDTDTEETSYVDNRAQAEAGHGAGTGAARSVVDAGVKVVLTPRVGPKAASVLDAAGIKVLGGVENASVQEAYVRYRTGKLTELAG